MPAPFASCLFSICPFCYALSIYSPESCISNYHLFVSMNVYSSSKDEECFKLPLHCFIIDERCSFSPQVWDVVYKPIPTQSQPAMLCCLILKSIPAWYGQRNTMSWEPVSGLQVPVSGLQVRWLPKPSESALIMYTSNLHWICLLTHSCVAFIT